MEPDNQLKNDNGKLSTIAKSNVTPNGGNFNKLSNSNVNLGQPKGNPTLNPIQTGSNVANAKPLPSNQKGIQSPNSVPPKPTKQSNVDVAKVDQGQQPVVNAAKPKNSDEEILDEYKLNLDGELIQVQIIYKKNDFVPEYNLSIMNISNVTKLVLDRIKEEFVTKIKVGEIEIAPQETDKQMKKTFESEILSLIKKYFPYVDKGMAKILINHLIQQSIGLGEIELLLKDPNLEEITVNNAKEPVWVYHRKYKWLKTNVKMPNEKKIRHYSSMIGRNVGKEISTLEPLMDAHLLTGDRVNATLYPISSKGNTITIRKFAEKPWTVTDFINNGTMSFESAAMVWQVIQFELSMLIAGGTGSGKTSTLNVVSNFFPPNQRIISIEDTREITLPESLHWVPLETRLPNPEGKGGITMLDLVVNSLRMRPDRIIVGEIRRKEEAEVLFEAMHTGHSVYATLHANNAEETVTRLTNAPINVPKLMLPAVSVILVQYRNRRTGLRKTLQIAEVTKTGDARVVYQLNSQTGVLHKVKKPQRIYETLNLYTGMNERQIENDLREKIDVLKWLVARKINDINKIGLIIAKYYLQKSPIKKGK